MTPRCTQVSMETRVPICGVYPGLGPMMLMVDLSVSAGDCAAMDRARRGMLAAKATVELRKVRRVGCGAVEFTGDSPELGWWPAGEAYHESR